VTIRHNLCPNPAAGANATGWSSNGTLTRQASGVASMPVTTGMRWTSNGFVQTPTGVVSPGQVITASYYLGNFSGFAANNKTVYLAFTRSAGGDDFSQTTTVSYAASGNTSRLSVTGTAPANATGVYLILDAINGVGSGSYMDISAVLYEVAGSLDTYFDGNSANCTWDGTANNSASTFDDSAGTTPVSSDLDIRYRVRNVVTSDLSIKYRVDGVPSDGSASYDLNEILDALAALFQDVTTGDQIGGVAVKISAYADVPDEVITPAVVLELDDLDWDQDMGGGADSFTILASVLVQNADNQGAQRAMRAFLSRKATAGVARLKAVLEADKTLGGLVSYAHLARVRDIGEITYGNITYLGADLVIEVMS
jgi:hypothetical protein